jgi:hypothetical protein
MTRLTDERLDHLRSVAANMIDSNPVAASMGYEYQELIDEIDALKVAQIEPLYVLGGGLRGTGLVWINSARAGVSRHRIYPVVDVNDAGDLCFLDDNNEEQWVNGT